MQPVIKWSGSKRSQSEEILKHMPKEFDKYYEPFIGGGAILYTMNHKEAVCGDICKPLIELWKQIRDNPKEIGEKYEMLWNELQQNGQDFYYNTRTTFNAEQKPEQLLFLSRTCTNGLIRFNQKGEFNNSFHLNRPGINPQKLKNIIEDWSQNIQNAKFYHCNYYDLVKTATDKDFVYLDPPYFHTKGMYFGTIDYNKFVDFLRDLNKRNIRFMLSYDGKRGDESFEVELPKDIYKQHILIESGVSSFNRLQNKSVMVQESLYMNY
jgi:DNA adenine methylase